MTQKDPQILLVEDNAKDVTLTLHALREENLGNSIQVARDGEEALDFNVSYVPSSDCSLTSGPERLSGRFLSKVDLKQMLGVLVAAPIKLKPRSWLVLIVDPAGNECHYANISVAAGATGVLGANGTLRTLAAHEEKTLYLVFPPGDGTVTVQSISLSPRTASAPVAP